MTSGWARIGRCRARRPGLERLDDAPDRALQPLGAHGLQQVVDGGEVERLEGALLVGGDEHEHGPALEARQGAGEVEAGESRHVDVEEGRIDRLAREQPDRLGTRRGLVDDADARVLPEQEGQLVDRGLLVVGDEHGDHGLVLPSRFGPAFGTRMRTRVPAPTFVSTTSPCSSP